MKNPIEIMSPGGSYESLTVAITVGADSVYFGVGEFNMRSKAKFGEKDLERIVKICNEKSRHKCRGISQIIEVNR